MNTNYSYSQYSLADIERYLQGKMTPEEMHAIEKAALQDPFLADAIDGFETADIQLSKKQLNEVAALITGKNENHKVVTMHAPAKNWWRVAVAVFVLMSIGIITAYFFNDRQQNNALSATETNKPLKVDDTIVSNVVIDSITNDKLSNTKQQQISVPAKTKTSKNNTSDIIAETIRQNPPIVSERADNQSGAAQSSGITSAAKDQKEIAADANARPKSIAPAVAAPVSRDQFSSYNYTPSNNARNSAPAELRGRVLNSNGEPLSYASVEYKTMNNSRAATVTDANGNFELRSYDTTLKVDIATLGYERQRANISANRSNIIVLNEEPSSLSEVVITGMNAKKQQPAIKTDSRQFEDLYPKGGWVSFEQYAQRKLGKVKVKDSIHENETNEDFIEVEFDIDHRGKPANIALLRSSGAVEKDKDIIQMIKEGPRWINKNKKAAVKGKVVIKL